MALVLLLGLSACDNSSLPAPSGEADKSPDQVLADARAAMAAVHAYRVASTNEFRDGHTNFSLDFDPAGNFRGTFTVSGQQADIVVVGGQVYIRGNGFWSAIYAGSGIPAAQMQVILGKIGTHFVHDPGDVLSLVADSRQLLPTNTPDCMGVHGRLSKGGTEVLGGRRVVVVNDDGSEPGGMPGRYLVADASPHRLLEADSHGPQTVGQQAASGKCPAGVNITAGDVDPSRKTTFSFSQFDTVDAVARPADSVEIAPG